MIRKLITKGTKNKYQRVIRPSLGGLCSGSTPNLQTRSKTGSRNISLMEVRNYPIMLITVHIIMKLVSLYRN